MRPFVLYHPKTRTTGRAIANLLGVPSGTKCGRQYQDRDTIIRWGNIREVSATYYNTELRSFSPRREINTRKAVSLAGSKFKSLQALSAGGVNVPVHTRDMGVVAQALREHPDILWYGRRFRHMGATDIVLVSTPPIMAANSDYYTQGVHNIKEYRVHVVGGSPIRFQKKYFGEELFQRVASEYLNAPIDDCEGADLEEFRDECNLIRNNAHGWRFYDVKDAHNVPEVIKEQALKAIEVLGLHFGAVDILLTKKDEHGQRKGIVLEVNTAPGLRDSNLELYANALSVLLGEMAVENEA